MNLFNKIKKLFTKKSDIIIEDILDGDFIDFVNISAVSFLHESVVQSIYQDIIVLIINNNLVADPSKILAFFKRNYNFTNNEFFVLAFKMGVIVKMYVDNPVLMLESAVKLTEIFKPQKIADLQSILNKQIILNNQLSEKNYTEYKENKKRQEIKDKLNANDPDSLIDDWLEKNKK